MSTSKLFSTETSERYARALFDVAKENSEIEKIESCLKTFLDVYNSSPELINFIKNPTKSNNIQLEAVSIISLKLNFSKNLKNFFSLLVEKRRIFFVEKIIQSFLN